nr:MAG TPA: hypothetical protein [Caudoviricetes sp.]DAV82859.1 MAG TPA: hypothetical protein [Caudoviricetes sp.]
MATTDEKTLNAGLWEVALGDMLIPAEFLGDIKTKIAMKTVEKDTQAGTSKRRTNVVDTAEATFTLYLPSLDFLGKIFPEYYARSTAGGGAVTFGGKSVKVAEMPVNMHQKGAETDENDVHFFKASVNVDFELSQTTSDDPSVEITLNAQPTENGYVRLGTGDLTKKSVYDVATQRTKAVAG